MTDYRRSHEASLSLKLTSSAFEQGEAIPARHTCTGQNISPPLNWEGVPASAKSLTLICEDPDAPVGTFYHWGLYDLPAGLTSLAEGAPLPSGAKSVLNSFNAAGYRGPCPPRGHGTHHYHFRLFALSVATLPLGSSAGCRELLRAVETHVIASAELMGTFAR
jgi:Raf kinase inhibitor-like YbhB/YbcL family protein